MKNKEGRILVSLVQLRDPTRTHKPKSVIREPFERVRTEPKAKEHNNVVLSSRQTTKQLNNKTTRQQNNQTPTTKHQQPIIIYFYLLIFYFSTKQPDKKIHFVEKRKMLSEPIKSFGWLLYHPSGRKRLESPWNGEIRLFSLVCQSVHFKICECKGVRYLDNNRQSACGEGQCFHTLPSIPPSPS